MTYAKPSESAHERRFHVTVLAALALAFSLGLSVASKPAHAKTRSDTSEVLRQANGGITDTVGACYALSTTAEELISQIQSTYNLSDRQLNHIRFVELFNVDASIAMCSSVSSRNAGSGTNIIPWSVFADDSNASSVSCDALDSATQGYIPAGGSRTFRLSNWVGGTGGNSFAASTSHVPKVYAAAASGTPSVCVTIGF